MDIGDTYIDEWCNFIIVLQSKNGSVDALYTTCSEAIPSQGKILHFENEDEFYLKLRREHYEWKFITKVDGWMDYHRNKLVNSIKGTI